MTFYIIRSQMTGLVLTAEGEGRRPNSKVTPQQQNNQDNQIFFDDNATGTIRLKSSNFCLDIEDGVLVVRPYQRCDPNQMWIRSDPYIRNLVDPHRVIDILGASKEKGAKISAYSFNGGENQRWSFEPINGHQHQQQQQNQQQQKQQEKQQEKQQPYTKPVIEGYPSVNNNIPSYPPTSDLSNLNPPISRPTADWGVMPAGYPEKGEYRSQCMYADVGYHNTGGYPTHGGYMPEGYPIHGGYPNNYGYLGHPSGYPGHGMYPIPGGYPTHGAFPGHNGYPGPSGIHYSDEYGFQAIPGNILTSGEFYIVSEMHGKVLDIAGSEVRPGAPVLVWDKKTTGCKNQLWRMDEEGNIHSVLNDLVFYCNGYGNAITMQPMSESARSQWKFVGMKIVNKIGEVLDIAQENCNSGAPVIAYKYQGQKNQHWFQAFL